MRADILLIEDDERIADNIQVFLSNRSNKEWNVMWADNGFDGLSLALSENYDLILLDVMLPGLDGFRVCEKIREKKTVPVIFLTARHAEEDVLTGYALGGDDYIVKPFSLAQLSAKIQAMLARTKSVLSDEVLNFGSILMNLTKASVTVNGRSVTLPLKEYEILRFFLQNTNRLVTKEALIVNVWGYDSEMTERGLDNHIKLLRKALVGANAEIITLRGQGYRFTLKETDERYIP